MSQKAVQGGIQLPDVTGSGTMAQLLAGNVGRRVEAEFWVGSNAVEKKSGVLAAASDQYIVLYDPETGGDVVCEFYSLRFMHFLPDNAVHSPAQERENAGESPETDAEITQSVRPVSAPARVSQAAFNYARRKCQKLE